MHYEFMYRGCSAKCFSYLDCSHRPGWSLKAFPLHLYLILQGDGVLIIHLAQESSTLEISTNQNIKAYFCPQSYQMTELKKHLHHSPGLKQRNLWSLGDNLGKVPDIKAKKLFLCEGLLWHSSPEVAWRLVPTAPGGGMQAMSEGHRDREGKGWKREGSSCGTNWTGNCQPSHCGSTFRLCNGASLKWQ